MSPFALALALGMMVCILWYSGPVGLSSHPRLVRHVKGDRTSLVSAAVVWLRVISYFSCGIVRERPLTNKPMGRLWLSDEKRKVVRAVLSEHRIAMI